MWKWLKIILYIFANDFGLAKTKETIGIVKLIFWA